MIVYKIWEHGYQYNRTFKRWEGWFLFGIIPLYVRQTAYSTSL